MSRQRKLWIDIDIDRVLVLSSQALGRRVSSTRGTCTAVRVCGFCVGFVVVVVILLLA